ncbi:precorrin-2 C(20)-methyltransferase [Siculibacillus lacustris]
MALDLAPAAPATGTFHGVGLGPGDPDLVTVRAVKIIERTPVVAFFSKKGRRGHARTIADPWIGPDKVELALPYPMTTETHFGEERYISSLGAFYEESAARIAEELDGGRDVALICEGDPMFYGSFMHLHLRLKDRYPTAVTPGVTGMAGCWAAAGLAMTWGDDVLSVLPGTLDEEALVAGLHGCQATVVMKLGTNFAKVRRAIDRAGLLARATYVERGTMAGQTVVPLADKLDDSAPYFSLILIPGEGRRP